MTRASTWAPLLLLGALVSAGCASSPAAERAGASDGARDQEPAAPAQPEGEDLSSDPYRKVPSGEGPDPEDPVAPAARFRSPRAPEPARRLELDLPARLGVLFVREGSFVHSGPALLRLEASLAEAEALRGVLALSLPRGAERDLDALGREARAARFDLLLVLELPQGAGYLVRTQGREPSFPLLARFEPPRPGDPDRSPSHRPGPLEDLVERLGRAHRALCRGD